MKKPKALKQPKGTISVRLLTNMRAEIVTPKERFTTFRKSRALLQVEPLDPHRGIMFGLPFESKVISYHRLPPVERNSDLADESGAKRPPSARVEESLDELEP